MTKIALIAGGSVDLDALRAKVEIVEVNTPPNTKTLDPNTPPGVQEIIADVPQERAPALMRSLFREYAGLSDYTYL